MAHGSHFAISMGLIDDGCRDATRGAARGHGKIITMRAIFHGHCRRNARRHFDAR